MSVVQMHASTSVLCLCGRSTCWLGTTSQLPRFKWLLGTQQVFVWCLVSLTRDCTLKTTRGSIVLAIVTSGDKHLSKSHQFNPRPALQLSIGRLQLIHDCTCPVCHCDFRSAAVAQKQPPNISLSYKCRGSWCLIYTWCSKSD